MLAYIQRRMWPDRVPSPPHVVDAQLVAGRILSVSQRPVDARHQLAKTQATDLSTSARHSMACSISSGQFVEAIPRSARRAIPALEQRSVTGGRQQMDGPQACVYTGKRMRRPHSPRPDRDSGLLDGRLRSIMPPRSCPRSSKLDFRTIPPSFLRSLSPRNRRAAIHRPPHPHARGKRNRVAPTPAPAPDNPVRLPGHEAGRHGFAVLGNRVESCQAPVPHKASCHPSGRRKAGRHGHRSCRTAHHANLTDPYGFVEDCR